LLASESCWFSGTDGIQDSPLAARHTNAALTPWFHTAPIRGAAEPAISPNRHPWRDVSQTPE